MARGEHSLGEGKARAARDERVQGVAKSARELSPVYDGVTATYGEGETKRRRGIERRPHSDARGVLGTDLGGPQGLRKHESKTSSGGSPTEGNDVGDVDEASLPRSGEEGDDGTPRGQLLVAWGRLW